MNHSRNRYSHESLSEQVFLRTFVGTGVPTNLRRNGCSHEPSSEWHTLGNPASPALLLAVWQQVSSAVTGCSVRQVVSHSMRAGFQCRLTSAISYVLPQKVNKFLMSASGSPDTYSLKLLAGKMVQDSLKIRLLSALCSGRSNSAY